MVRMLGVSVALHFSRTKGIWLLTHETTTGLEWSLELVGSWLVEDVDLDHLCHELKSNVI
jgi:hypothetical protein